MVPTTIAALEEAVLARLKEQVPGVAVEPYPANPDTYAMLHPRGALLVCYQGADYGPPEQVEVTAQARKLSVAVFVQVRQLSGHAGAYVYLEAARVALAGHTVPGFGPLTPVRERMVGQNGGVWTFALTLTADTVAVHLEEEAAGALLKRLTVASDYHVSEVVSE